MKTTEDYSLMQKSQYSARSTVPEDVVGNYAWHENFPYETNLLFRYADIRLPIFGTSIQERALDVGCGPGRMITRMRRFFRQIDGADISAYLLEIAQKEHPKSAFFETNGSNLGNAPADSYDFVYSTIALQHIAVNSIRNSIYREILRVLKPGGKFTIQFAYLDTLPYIIRRDDPLLSKFRIARGSRVTAHADWSENRTNASSTNGACDTTLGPNSLPIAVNEFKSLFDAVEYWFYDIRICLADLRGASHCDYWASHWIFFHGTKPVS